LGRKIEDIMPKDIAELQMSAIKETITTQQTQTLKFMLPWKDITFFYEYRLVFLNDDRVAAYVRDITERKLYEQELKKSEEKFKTIYIDSPIGIELYDHDGKLVDLNKSCLEMFGVSSIDAVKDFDLLNDPNIPPDQLSKLKEGESVKFESVFDFDLVKSLNLYETKKSGQSYIDVIITPLYIDNQEMINNYLVQIQDVTERKYGEKEIQKHNREYTALLEASKAVLKNNDFVLSSKAIFNACTKLLGAPAGYIALLTPDKEENQIVFLNPGGYICSVDSELPMPIRGMRREVIKSKKALYNNNFQETDWTQFLPNGHVNLESVLFIPLIIDNDVKGLMGVANKPGGFTDEDINLASAFAEFVSIALQNSQALDSLEKSEQRYRNLSSKLEQNVIERTRELKESEENFKMLYENAPLSYQSLDYKGDILEVNKTWLEFFGYSKNEVIGKWFGDFIDQDYQKVLETNFPKFKEEGEVNAIEYEIIKKDGSHAIVAFDGKISYDQQGYFKQTHCIFRDITVQKKAEQMLKDSEEKYRILFEQAPYIIMLCDLKGTILDCNSSIERVTGYERDELLGKNFSELNFLSTDQLSILNERIKTISTGQVPEPIELALKKKDGSHLWVHSTNSILQADNKAYVQAIIQDITPRKDAEQKLRESEEKFRMLFNNVNDAIVILDTEGNVIECNQTSYERLGYTREEFLNMTPMDFDTPEYAVGVLDRIELVIQNGASSYEVEHMRKDGKIVPVEINSIIINLQGNPAVLSVARDITERKKAEKELKDSEAKYRSIIDNSGSSIVVLDKDGFYEIVNKQAAESLGGKPEDFVQKSLFDIYSRDIAEEYFRNNKKIIETGTGRQYERTFDLPNGARTFLINEQAISDSEGRGLYLTSSSVDITERKLFEQRLKESEAKYRSII
ncbi:hypothetical protein LCGC14_1785940, partial [marine sediment metagenome]